VLYDQLADREKTGLTPHDGKVVNVVGVSRILMWHDLNKMCISAFDYVGSRWKAGRAVENRLCVGRDERNGT